MPQTPRPLLALCLMFVGIAVFRAFANDLGLVNQLLWAAVLAVLSMNTISGGRKSAIALMIVAYLNGFLDLGLLLLFPRVDTGRLLVLVSGLVSLSLAIFLTKSKQVAAIQAAALADRSSKRS